MPTSAFQSLRAWLPTLPWLIAIGFVFWFGALSTFNLSIDQEFALFRSDERVWISQGRWAIFFLTQYLYTQPVIGYFPHLLFVIMAAVSYVLLVDAFAVSPRQRLWVLLAAAFFMAHPVWVFITEFYTNLLPTALGMLSCSLALWCLARVPGYGSRAAQVALIVFALGNYQAFLLVMSVLYVAYFLQQYATARYAFKQLLQQGLWALACLAVALLLNQLLLQGLYTLYDVAPSYVNNLLNTDALLSAPWAVMRSVLKGSAALYGGSAKLYSSSLLLVGLVALIGIGRLLYQAHQHRRLLLSIALLLLLLLIPFLLHVAAGGFWFMPLRAGLTVPFVVGFLSLYAVLQLPTPWWRGVLVGLLVLANSQLLHLQARYSTAKQLTLAYDQQLAAQLFNRLITVVPDYSFSQGYPFSVHGGLRYHSPIGGVDTTTITGSFFWWDGGNAHRISHYMNALGYHGLEPVSAAQQEALKPVYAQMPVWPAQGAVQVHEGVIMVKLAQ